MGVDAVAIPKYQNGQLSTVECWADGARMAQDSMGPNYCYSFSKWKIYFFLKDRKGLTDCLEYWA